MDISILVAMEKELRQLKQLLQNARTEEHNGRVYHVGDIGIHHVTLHQCGIGKVNAAMAATEMINRYAPKTVISSGVAGGCGADVHVGDVVVSSACRYHDAYCGSECSFGQILGLPECFPSPAKLVDRACHLPTSMVVHAGVIATGDWFVDSREKMQSILDNVPDAQAVDMESAAIAQVCYIKGVPFVSFRIISDTPLNDEKAAQYFDFWDRLTNGSFEVVSQFVESL